MAKCAALFVAFCPRIKKETKKGTYIWPRAGFNSRKEQPCKSGEGANAYYTCNKEGKWVDLDVQACKYDNRITRVLKELSMVSYFKCNCCFVTHVLLMCFAFYFYILFAQCIN